LGGRTVNYTYDDLYRLTSESIANDQHGINGSLNYSYDPVGNRLSRTSTVTPVTSQSSTYDANDRLTSDSYDPNGNTTSANSNTYAYDFENRLTILNGGSVRYVYDGDGNRVANLTVFIGDIVKRDTQAVISGVTDPRNGICYIGSGGQGWTQAVFLF
jgi:uncharacterized protein RhaS with RHS repeats